MWSEHNCPPHLGEVLTTRVLFLREGALTVRRGRPSGRPYCFHNGLGRFFLLTRVGFRWLLFQARLILFVLTTLLFLLLLIALDGLITANVGRLIPRFAC